MKVGLSKAIALSLTVTVLTAVCDNGFHRTENPPAIKIPESEMCVDTLKQGSPHPHPAPQMQLTWIMTSFKAK